MTLDDLWPRRKFLRLLSAVPAATGIVALVPASASKSPVPREGEVVARYLASGGGIPAWAKSPSFSAALAEEAEAHGLGAVAGDPTPGRLPPEGTIASALRLAQMLASGAVVPRVVQRSWTIPTPPFAPEAALGALVSLDDPLPWLRGLAPPGEGYRRLQGALAQYRAIARQGGWRAIASSPPLALGSASERVATLRSRLLIEGDLAPEAAQGSVFDAAMERAVRNFQSRHGLEADGRLGRETLAAMNVDAHQRCRQIAANMERWRWLPRRLPPGRIMVNAAAARLVLFDGDSPTLQLRTIVGTPRHPTPALAATIVSLLFNPPWDIPTSIAANEIRPLARRDPGYLRRESIVATKDGKRLRQLPGPKNALGSIKFEMPNPLDVYLHDTPSKPLFDRTRRFFSHGCIRVQHPDELALHLLRQDPEWTTETYAAAVAAGTTRRVPVNPAIPVYVVYLTVTAEPGGQVTFLDDVYHRDAPLTDALFPASSVLSTDRRQRAETDCAPSERARRRSGATPDLAVDLSQSAGAAVES